MNAPLAAGIFSNDQTGTLPNNGIGKFYDHRSAVIGWLSNYEIKVFVFLKIKFSDPPPRLFCRSATLALLPTN
jgi:hypothetical protein